MSETDQFCGECGAKVVDTSPASKTKAPNVPGASSPNSRILKYLFGFLVIGAGTWGATNFFDSGSNKNASNMGSINQQTDDGQTIQIPGTSKIELGVIDSLGGQEEICKIDSVCKKAKNGMPLYSGDSIKRNIKGFGTSVRFFVNQNKTLSGRLTWSGKKAEFRIKNSGKLQNIVEITLHGMGSMSGRAMSKSLLNIRFGGHYCELRSVREFSLIVEEQSKGVLISIPDTSGSYPNSSTICTDSQNRRTLLSKEPWFF